MNSDDFSCYEGLHKYLVLYLEYAKHATNQTDQLVSLYETLGQQYKWSSAVNRIERGKDRATA